MNIEIRRLGPTDVRSVTTILHLFRQPVPSSDYVQGFLNSERHVLIAASFRGIWVGFALAYELPQLDGSSVLLLYGIDVTPEYRRRGVASALIAALWEMAKARHMKEFFALTTRSNTPAVELYKATGGILEPGETLLFGYPLSGCGTPSQSA